MRKKKKEKNSVKRKMQRKEKIGSGRIPEENRASGGEWRRGDWLSMEVPGTSPVLHRLTLLDVLCTSPLQGLKLQSIVWGKSWGSDSRVE